jgi:hypothetical protein
MIETDHCSKALKGNPAERARLLARERYNAAADNFGLEVRAGRTQDLIYSRGIPVRDCRAKVTFGVHPLWPVTSRTMSWGLSRSARDLLCKIGDPSPLLVFGDKVYRIAFRREQEKLIIVYMKLALKDRIVQCWLPSAYH